MQESVAQNGQGAVSELFTKGLRSLRWLPTYGWQRLTRRLPVARPTHLMIGLADQQSTHGRSNEAGAPGYNDAHHLPWFVPAATLSKINRRLCKSWMLLIALR